MVIFADDNFDHNVVTLKCVNVSWHVNDGANNSGKRIQNYSLKEYMK